MGKLIIFKQRGYPDKYAWEELTYHNMRNRWEVEDKELEEKGNKVEKFIVFISVFYITFLIGAAIVGLN